MSRRPTGHEAMDALASLEALDPPAGTLGKAVRGAIPRGPFKDAISGTWLGHALHPLLTDVTIGSFTGALMLDWLGGSRSRPAAQRLIGIGLLSAGPTVTAGASDWADTEVGSPAARRIGLLHAAGNTVAASLFAASYIARRRGAHGSGRALALVGGAALGAGGFLGGHLSFAEGVGVDQTTFEPPHEEWTDVLAENDLPDAGTGCVDVAGTPVLLARSGGEVRALSNRCAHRGGPLHEGELGEGTITCPWHGSEFALADGSLVHGPSAYPQPAWDARVRDGRIEVRRR
jgi:nitrite reductase/ring-hydroxylating ferredoxin subunit/uncharacterized membrane protein